MNDTLPRGKISRATVAGVTAARIGAKKFTLSVRRPFLSADTFEHRQAETDAEMAEVLLRGVSKLRGGALKIAQMMSLELGVLPEAYRKELYRSQYRVPPMNRAVIRRVVTGEFGKPPEEVFERFDATAFAAASLGQVHHARSWAGERLAVKVQYPGVGSALKNDVLMLRQLIPPSLRTGHLFDMIGEVGRRLSEELDYDLERRTTRWFHDNGRTPGVVLPRVFDEYSSPLVLTAEFLEGAHLDEWLRTNPSQEERDRAAQRLYDFFMRSLFELHKIHADPNPGNYLFRDDGSVAVIDFGAVKAFEPEFCERLLALWRAHLRNDTDGIISLYCSLGLAGGDERRVRRSCRTTLRLFGEWMSLPYKEEVFDFGKHPDFCSQGAKMFRDVLMLEEMNGFTTEAVLFDRSMYGLYRIFTALGARVRTQNRWVH